MIEDLGAVVATMAGMRLCQALGERNRALDNNIALTVHRDDVIAVIEHAGLDCPAECCLQIGGVAKAGAIIVARSDAAPFLRARMRSAL